MPPLRTWLAPWRLVEQDTPQRLRIWSDSRLGQAALALCAVVLDGLAVHTAITEQRASSLLVAVLLSWFFYRFATSRVDVDAAGIHYRGVLRTRHLPWSRIIGFATAAHGVGVVLDNLREVWLTPTKRQAWSSEARVRSAEATLRRIIARAPNPEEYELP